MSKPNNGLRQPLQALHIPEARLRVSTVMAVTGWSESTLRRRVAANDFPPPVKDGLRCTRWIAGDVTKWLRRSQAGA